MEPLSSPIRMSFSTNIDDAINKTLVIPIARTMDDIAVMAQDKGAVAMIGLYLQGCKLFNGFHVFVNAGCQNLLGIYF